MEISLKGKRAFVNGGSDGIGRSIAIEMAKCGATVTVSGRNVDKLKKVISEMNSGWEGEYAHNYIQLDHSNIEDLEIKMKNISTVGYDILVNNTGGPSPKSVNDISVSEMVSSINQNVISFHIMTKYLIGQMNNNRYGRIFNILSTSAKQPMKNMCLSNMTRSCISSWAKTLSKEVASSGINVYNILPDVIQTERLNNLLEAKAISKNDTVENVIKMIAEDTPVGRIGKPKDVADLVCFLSTEKGSFITGVSIQVDGGRLGVC